MKRSRRLDIALKLCLMLLFVTSVVYAGDPREGFVTVDTVDTTRFMLDGRPYYYTGTNNYYLGIDP